jgi:hypothetical protein
MFMPIMSSVLYPSNDAVGYFAAVLVLWACVSVNVSPLFIGLIIGAGAQLRSQMIFFVIFAPFLLLVIDDQRTRIGSALSVAITALVSYVAIGAAISHFFELPKTDGEDGISFYIKFFSQSFYGLNDLPIVLKQFSANILNLGRPAYLSIFLYTGLLAILYKRCTLARALAFVGFMIVSVPLLIYSLDRYSAPHARYYTAAVPFLALSWFLYLKNGPRRASILLALVTTLLVTLTWYSNYSRMYRNITSFDIIKNRLEFLDFPEAQAALNQNFAPDALLLTNHALPAGLAKIKAFIPYPEYSEFFEGDNREVDGITFLYSEKGVNEFFKPTSWLQNGVLPELLKDQRGTSFQQIAHFRSYLRNGAGDTEDTVHFVIYKNSDPLANHPVDGGGQRIYSVDYHTDLTRPVTAAADFKNLEYWHPREPIKAGEHGRTVGPGPNNRNVVSQQFYTNGNTEFLVKGVARAAGSRFGRGRLQVNWVDAEGKLLRADISVFTAGLQDQEYRRFMVSPSGAISGWVYVTPHGEKDAIHFSSMGVYTR